MREKDDFWDIEKLLPPKNGAQKKQQPDRSGIFRAPTPVLFTDEVELGGQTNASEQGILTLPSSNDAKPNDYAEDLSYRPTWNPLIRRITVKRRRDRYDFYDGFRKAAILYYDVPGSKCDFLPFYSYMPQYAQMNRDQRAYYFYFRSEVREGRFPKTDYSYIYLLVYEILNLPDNITKERGIELLCTLWQTYRKALPGIDKYFSVWVQDYCMIHRLPAPTARMRSFIVPVIAGSEFKEFYLSDIDSVSSEGITAMTAYLSQYNWQNGKYATGEHSELYRMHMIEAIKPLLSEIMANAVQTGDHASIIVRDAFPYSLCTHSVKCRLEIEYYPLSRATALRTEMTMAIKYAENRLRAAMGVKSRLSVQGLPDRFKRTIDAYFDGIFEQKKREQRIANLPEYEKMYDVAHEPLSFAGAEEIERTSWGVTMKLVDEEDAEQIRAENAMPIAQSAPAPPAPTAQTIPHTTAAASDLRADDESVRFLRALLSDEGPAASHTICGAEADVLAERINEYFAEEWGDIVMEQTENGYCLLEDYREDIEEWLRNSTT